MAGFYRYPVYEAACADALERLGSEVHRFPCDGYFKSLPGRAEEKFVVAGPLSRRMNRDLRIAVKQVRPDVVFMRRGTQILPKTLREIKRTIPALLVSYNNDDPFSPAYKSSKYIHQRRLWRLFLEAIPLYDLHLVYRPLNIPEFENAGARRVHLLRSYYVPDIHYPVQLTDEERELLGCDVVFIGHYEPHRLEHIDALLMEGLTVRVFGPPRSWRHTHLGGTKSQLPPIREVFGRDYAAAICAAKVALCSFSKLNRDSYTRRAFEITACGTAMLSERTDEMRRLFPEDEAACYFSSTPELVEKARLLASSDNLRQGLAEEGRVRCIQGRHSVDDRMRDLMDVFTKELEVSRTP